LNRLYEISTRVDVPLVLHGGSGLSDDDFKNSIQNGINKINIFTDMSLAAIKRIKEDICRPVGYLDLNAAVVEAIKEEVAGKIRLFGSNNKA
jgi:fructose-bisphosphate aldolase class II